MGQAPSKSRAELGSVVCGFQQCVEKSTRTGPSVPAWSLSVQGRSLTLLGCGAGLGPQGPAHLMDPTVVVSPLHAGVAHTDGVFSDS